MNITYKMAEPKTCALCCDEFNKSTKKEINCNNCDHSICKTCARHWLTSTKSDPKCPNCNVGWNRNYLIMNLNRSYVNKEYREHRTGILLDIEMGKLPETMPFAERAKVVNNLKKENEEYNNQLKKLHDETTLLTNKIRINSRKINHPDSTSMDASEERKKFMMACPNDGCRGFLSTSYKCGLCNLFTCPDCLTIIGKNKNEEHKCNSDDVKSAEFIKTTTRPCPCCAERIYKIEGCDQMFCTSIKKDGSVCGTTFSWKTGKAQIGGTIHNPHYYALQKQQGNLVRNPGDVVCGGVPNIRSFGSIMTVLFTKNAIKNAFSIKASNQDSVIHHTKFKIIVDFYGIHNLVAEINQYILPRTRQEVTNLNDNTGHRVKYLLNEINKDELAVIINKNDIARQKKMELLNIYEILGVTGIEALNDIIQNIDTSIFTGTISSNTRRVLEYNTNWGAYVNEISNMSQSDWHTIINNIADKLDEKINNFKKVIDYCNEEFKVIGINYNCNSHFIPYYKGSNNYKGFYEEVKSKWYFGKKKYSIKDIKDIKH